MPDKELSTDSRREQRAFFIKRSILGLVGFACLSVWVFFYFTQGFANIPAGVDVLCRIGLMLAVVWFALPTIAPMFRYGSSLIIGIVLVILVICAARPQIARIVITIAVVAVIVNWILKKLSGSPSNRPNKERSGK